MTTIRTEVPNDEQACLAAAHLSQWVRLNRHHLKHDGRRLSRAWTIEREDELRSTPEDVWM